MELGADACAKDSDGLTPRDLLRGEGVQRQEAAGGQVARHLVLLAPSCMWASARVSEGRPASTQAGLSCPLSCVLRVRLADAIGRVVCPAADNDWSDSRVASTVVEAEVPLTSTAAREKRGTRHAQASCILSRLLTARQRLICAELQAIHLHNTSFHFLDKLLGVAEASACPTDDDDGRDAAWTDRMQA